MVDLPQLKDLIWQKGVKPSVHLLTFALFKDLSIYYLKNLCFLCKNLVIDSPFNAHQGSKHFCSNRKSFAWTRKSLANLRRPVGGPGGSTFIKPPDNKTLEVLTPREPPEMSIEELWRVMKRWLVLVVHTAQDLYPAKMVGPYLPLSLINLFGKKSTVWRWKKACQIWSSQPR